jgi:uncharacterized protein YkwD
LNFKFNTQHNRLLASLLAVAAIILMSSCTTALKTTYVHTALEAFLSKDGSQVPLYTSQDTSSATRSSPDANLNYSYGQDEIFQYMLDLINADRRAEGLDPVELGHNPAAQEHAQDMLANYYISHWGTDGLKPYMRYTKDGGINYEQENDAYHGWYDPQKDPSSYVDSDVKQTLYNLEYAMLNYDGPSNGHRKNILNRLHKKVNLGIAFDSKRLALVEQFEGDYIEYTRPPAIDGGIFTVSGRLLEGRLKNIQIFFDELPKTYTPDELLSEFHGSYSLGNEAGFIIPPPPPGVYYTNLSSKAVIADQWGVGRSGMFIITADISRIMSMGKGVYTFVVVAEINNEPVCLTNYSIFVD